MTQLVKQSNGAIQHSEAFNEVQADVRDIRAFCKQGYAAAPVIAEEANRSCQKLLVELLDDDAPLELRISGFKLFLEWQRVWIAWATECRQLARLDVDVEKLKLGLPDLSVAVNINADVRTTEAMQAITAILDGDLDSEFPSMAGERQLHHRGQANGNAYSLEAQLRADADSEEDGVVRGEGASDSPPGPEGP